MTSTDGDRGQGGQGEGDRGQGDRVEGGRGAPDRGSDAEPLRPEPGGGPPLTHWRILTIAAPVVLSNATVPLQGALDTAVAGNLGETAALAAVGLGAELFGLMFGVFNFLQIGSSGLAAQALGKRDPEAAALTLYRGIGLAVAIALALILLQTPLIALGLALFEASAETESLTAGYFAWRIWGAPAELANYALIGWFAGQEMTRRLFQHQCALAGANAALTLGLALGLGWGVAGIGLATALASFIGLGYGLYLARGRLSGALPAGWRPERARLLDPDALRRLTSLNRDIFIRTLLLMAAFAWTARLGSLQGDAILAVNVVLLQFLLLSAYALDGFAIAAETLVGQAVGARDPQALDRAALATSLWAGLLAALIALLFTLCGPALIDLFAAAPEVRRLARDYLLWAALIPLIGFLPFQLDGIFVGATGARAMRDAMILTALAFFPGSWAMLHAFGNHGVWAALWIWLALRAATLGAWYPALRRRVATA